MAKSKSKKDERTFLGIFVDPSVKEELKKIAKAERRSLSAQVELFLHWGVQHLKGKEVA